MDAGLLTADAPAPFSRRERIGAWVLALLVAATRWPAVSRTLWDWDEALFALALRHYDVTAHHPHPPGFPLFIGAAKGVQALTSLDAFHALQCVTVLASLFVFPAMLLLARELRFSPFASMAAALLLSFFPNVWFFGGTAFSDVPSLVLVTFASVLLLRGRRSDAALLAGALLLGIAAGFRPQNLLIGCVPMLLALLARRRAAVVGALLLPLVVAISYGGAAERSGGWDAYRAALTKHEQYIRAADSFLGPRHPGLVKVADDFFLRPYRAPLLNVVISLLAAIGLWRLRRQALLPVAIFGPFLLCAWLYLDFHSASRFSIGYMPLFALLAAAGIPRRGRAITLGAVLAIAIVWMIPVLRVVHTTSSPPAAAIGWLRANVDPSQRVVYVDERLAAHAELLLPEYERRVVHVAPPLLDDPVSVLMREGESSMPQAHNFIRVRARIEGVARNRYFAVSTIEKKAPQEVPAVPRENTN